MANEETKRRLPLGPKGRWGPTLKIVRDPRKAFEEWSRIYGDPFLVTALNGPIVVTGRPELIKQIFGEDPETFAPFAVETIRPLMGAGSLLLMEGQAHKRERRMLMPMFHGDRMKAYAETMQQVAKKQIQDQPSEFLTLPLMTDISLEIIVRAIFGGTEGHAIQRLMRNGTAVAKKCHPLLFFSKRMQFPFFGWSLGDRFRKARQSLYDGLDEILDQRKNEQGGDDILSMLTQATYEDGSSISREHIREQLMTFLFAGHETTALSLTWAMYHLHSNPHALKKLRDELDGTQQSSQAERSASDLAQLPYLKAVVQETLRLNPLVTEVLRFLKKPLVLGDYTLPAGMGVAPATVLAHYNSITYPEPEIFRPERFIEKSYSPFEYMPFGGGHRRCIGAAFAGFEMAIVLGTLLKNFEFELLESEPVISVRRNIVLGPSKPVRLRFKKRVSQRNA